MEYGEMFPHQQRVVDEKLDLDRKIGKLDDFISFSNPNFSKLSDKEQQLLCRQYDVMTEYSDILGERMAAFGTD